jgi:hypothetical protein
VQSTLAWRSDWCSGRRVAWTTICALRVLLLALVPAGGKAGGSLATRIAGHSVWCARDNVRDELVVTTGLEW